MQGGEDMIEQVFDFEAEAVEIALSGGRQIVAANAPFASDAAAGEPG